MIKLNGFEGYFLDLKTMEVFSLKRNHLMKIGYTRRNRHKVYRLYSNGEQIQKNLFQIIKENFQQIQLFFK